MKKYACQYAIARFLPYVETGEFANVGIVMVCPETNYFDFRLLGNKTKRITAFFEELKVNVYRKAQADFLNELKRIQNYINDNHAGRATPANLLNNLFAELVRPREVMIYFDAVRPVLTNDPALKLEELFSFYVERSFSTPVYQETLIEKNIRGVLRSADLLKKYKKETLGNKEAYRATFPFVYFENDVAKKVIKPLNLSQSDPADIYDHGWAWLGKIRKLRDLNILHDEVLFAVKQPSLQDNAEYEMFNEVIETLKNDAIKIALESDNKAVLDFARA